MIKLLAYIIDGKTCGIDITSWDINDLGGNSAFKVSLIDETGYTDIADIDTWDRFGACTGKDYKYIRTQIYVWGVYIGWENLTFDEKKILCKWMASGIGVEYHNGETIWTDAEQFIFQQEFRNSMRDSRGSRNEAVNDFMTMMVFKGYATQASAEDMIKEIASMRELFLRDGLEGIGYGDNTIGLFNYLDNTQCYAKHAIIGVDQLNKTFTLLGDQRTLIIDYLRVRNSSGNDGKYYIVGTIFDNTNTIITVVESIPDITVDGDIYLNGFLRRACASEERRDMFLDIYVNGNY